MTEHETPTEIHGLPAESFYANMSGEDFIAEQNPQATKEGIEAAAEALAEVRGRSFSGRNPHLGRMIKCQVCGMRHRVNERTCVQRFATTNREGDPVQGELVPPEGLTQLTAKQVLGAKAFAKRRMRPRNKPKKPLTKWHRALIEAREKKESQSELKAKD